MKNIQIEMVLSFFSINEMEVLKTFHHKEINIVKEKDYLCLVINSSITHNIDEWLSYTLAIIDFNKNKEVLQLLESSILHIYLPAKSKEEKFSLEFSARNLEILWKLATVIDIDYGLIYPTT